MPSGAESSTVGSIPEPTGPYRVGAAQLDLNDPFRREIEHPNGRLVPILVYFPLQKGVHVLQDKILEERAPDPWEPLKVRGYSQKADLSLLVEGPHPVIILNHGNGMAMTDYAFLAEDLASHGYVVVSVQHQLKSDPKEPTYWKGHSLSKNALMVDNILFVFEWLKEASTTLFAGKIDYKQIGLIGYSRGANSLLLLANRHLDSFSKSGHLALLPRGEQDGVRECLILMETTGFPIRYIRRFLYFFS